VVLASEIHRVAVLRYESRRVIAEHQRRRAGQDLFEPTEVDLRQVPICVVGASSNACLRAAQAA
jgi:hypothetical protein